ATIRRIVVDSGSFGSKTWLFPPFCVSICLLLFLVFRYVVLYFSMVVYYVILYIYVFVSAVNLKEVPLDLGLLWQRFCSQNLTALKKIFGMIGQYHLSIHDVLRIEGSFS